MAASRTARSSVSAVPSMTLRKTLPVKPSVTITSASPVPTAKPSTLPVKRRPSAPLERRVGRLDVLGPLRRLGAVGEQRDARALHAEHRLHEGRAHVGELDEVLGPHLDVRAAVEQQERAAGDRHEHGERRAVHAAGAFHVKQPGREGGAGRAAGDERVGIARRRRRGPPGRSRPRASRARRAPGRRPWRSRPGRRRPPPRRGAAPRSAPVRLRPAQFGGRPEHEHADVARRGRERRAARDLGGAGVGPVRVERDRQLLSGHGRYDLGVVANGDAPAPRDRRRSTAPSRGGVIGEGRRPHGDASAAGTRCAVVNGS